MNGWPIGRQPCDTTVDGRDRAVEQQPDGAVVVTRPSSTRRLPPGPRAADAMPPITGSSGWTPCSPSRRSSAGNVNGSARSTHGPRPRRRRREGRRHASPRSCLGSDVHRRDRPPAAAPPTARRRVGPRPRGRRPGPRQRCAPMSTAGSRSVCDRGGHVLERADVRRRSRRGPRRRAVRRAVRRLADDLADRAWPRPGARRGRRRRARHSAAGIDDSSAGGSSVRGTSATVPGRSGSGPRPCRTRRTRARRAPAGR